MINRKLRFTKEAAGQLSNIEKLPHLQGVFKQVRKALGRLEMNPNHPSLNTHPASSLSIRYKTAIFESYAQNNTAGAYRIFWYYGDDETDEKGNKVPVITIIAITPHP